MWYTSKAFMKIIIDNNTYVSKELISTDNELWNFAGYIFLIIDKYFEQYMAEHHEDFFE